MMYVYILTNAHRTVLYTGVTDDPLAAIEREKPIKVWNRKRKIKLIEGKNPDWKDLYEDIL